jgi:hypothetical protein
MVIDDKSPLGVIYFERGLITCAATRKNQGYEAVMELLNLHFGSFRFFNDKRSSRKNLSISIMAVIMEWARKHDEEKLDKPV